MPLFNTPLLYRFAANDSGASGGAGSNDAGISSDEGYVKFSFDHDRRDAAVPAELFRDLEHWRGLLREVGGIGITPEGIGFGNLSARARARADGPARAPADRTAEMHPNGAAGPRDGAPAGRAEFFITGSATGGKAMLEPRHYARVTDYDIKGNHLACVGLTKASSESMSHAAIYEARPDVHAVCHIHHGPLWYKLCGTVPTTSEAIEYGTPEMALALAELARGITDPSDRLIVMGGHQDGLIAFGESIAAACRPFLQLLGSGE